jgi:hypothetical protein
MSTISNILPLVNWPDPKPLNDLAPVPELARDILPKCLGNFVFDQSDRMQAQPELVMAPLIVATGACAGRRFRIQPRRFDTDWTVVPNLYGAAVAPPGSMKSPTLGEVLKQLHPIERNWRECNQQALAEWLAKYGKKKGKKKEGDDVDDDDEPGEPKPIEKRLILNNVTWEQMHVILAGNLQGCLMVRDELAGLLAETEKSGHQGEREFILEAWNGNQPYDVDRVMRGSVHADAICLSLYGGIQPKKLRHYLSGGSGAALSDDGFAQRLQILVWPDQRPYIHTDRAPNKSASDAIAKIFRVLASFLCDPPLVFTFNVDDDAQGYFDRWHTNIQNRVRGNKDPAMLRSHLSKYPSLMPTLALLFELAERAAVAPAKRSLIANPELPDPKGTGLTVSLLNTMRADRLCEYLEAHAFRFYDCSTSEQWGAQILAKNLRQDTTIDTFTARDIDRKCWKSLPKQRIKTAIDLLVEKGWIAAVKRPTTKKGGKPTVEYRVNPKIREKSQKEVEEDD